MCAVLFSVVVVGGGGGGRGGGGGGGGVAGLGCSHLFDGAKGKKKMP